MKIQFKIESPFNFEDTVKKFKEQLAKQQFGVLWEMNFKDKLQEKGLQFDTDFKVMEACNPKMAKKVLDINIEAGYFLPCKVVVYKKEASVYMGMLLPTELIGLLGSDELIPIAQEVEEALKLAMKSTATAR